MNYQFKLKWKTFPPCGTTSSIFEDVKQTRREKSFSSGSEFFYLFYTLSTNLQILVERIKNTVEGRLKRPFKSKNKIKFKETRSN